ncbi:MAG TPA: response regulator [Thermoanaerobaculia bacterium]|nr:response regulator [Thermoanaerobaculia bacterium]
MNKRLLIIDNEEGILFALEKFFRRAGFGVQCARELEEAEALASCCNYDAVIIDLSLNGKGSTEGLEIIRYIRLHCPTARLILLTAHATPEIESEARRRGVHALLNKPHPLAAIAKTVTQLLEQKA